MVHCRVRTLVLLLLFGCSSASTGSCTSGAVGVVSQALIDGFKDAGLQSVKEWLPQQSWPVSVLKKRGIEVKDPFDVTLANASQVSVVLHEPASGATGGSVGIGFQGSAMGKVHIHLAWCQGHATFRLEDLSVSATTSFDLTAEGGLTLRMDEDPVTDFSDIHLSGSCAVPKVLDWIREHVGVLKKRVARIIGEQVNLAIPKVVRLARHWLRDFSYRAPLPLPEPFDRAVLDFHLCHATVRGEGPDAVLDVGISGEVRDSATPDDATPAVATHLPLIDSDVADGHMANLELGSYTADSLIYTFLSQGVLNYAVQRDAVPEGKLRDALSTSFYKIIAPTLWTDYPDHDMSLLLNVSSLPRTGISKGSLQARAGLDFIFRVEVADGDPVPVFALTCPAVLDGTLWTNSSSGPVTLQASISEVSDCDLSLKWSDVGNLGFFIVRLIESAAKAMIKEKLIPKANEYLEAGVAIPTIEVTAAGSNVSITLTNGTLFEEGGYGLLQANVTAAVTADGNPADSSLEQLLV